MSAPKTSYHVEAGHSLLYRQPGEAEGRYGILAGKPQLGGRSAVDGICYPDPATLRPATAEDFEFFRVCTRGHLS